MCKHILKVVSALKGVNVKCCGDLQEGVLASHWDHGKIQGESEIEGY